MSASPAAVGRMTSPTTPSRTTNLAEASPLLEVRDLHMHFAVTEGSMSRRVIGQVKAVDGVDFTIRRGETMGLVGESGCGKTTTGRCILRLEKPTSGQILFDGEDVASMPRRDLIALRRRMQVIFQDPYSSLNPRMKVGDIIGEPIKVHGVEPDAGRRRARVRSRSSPSSSSATRRCRRSTCRSRPRSSTCSRICASASA